MKKITIYQIASWCKKSFLFLSLFVLVIVTGCNKNPFPLQNYKQVNLVSDIDGFGAARIDKDLLNAWGIAVNPSGPIWLSANHSGLGPVYNRAGSSLRPAVTVPAALKGGPGAPTGVIFNPTTSFVIPSTGAVSKFIYAGEDGTISAWSGGNAAIIVADRSSYDAVYKGLAMAMDNGHNFIYAANFKGAKVDVFDENFKYVTSKPFKDPDVPAHFAPFNVRNIDGKLFVLYAMQKGPNNQDDQSGPGNGFVDIFDPNGTLLTRFASRGALNSPWGIVPSVPGFCPIPNAILIGNFGDGRINIYSEVGQYEGQLQVNGNPVAIEGLWALENNVPGGDPQQLFFTAGPGGEEHGLFGYLEKK